MDETKKMRTIASAPAQFQHMESTESHHSSGGLLRLLRQKSSAKSELGDLALFEEETPLLSHYLQAFTLPGPLEKDKSDRKLKKANLGTLLGVYLPTIQHIFGVLMFLRLYWIVGSMGVGQAFAMVFLCCVCTFLTSISMSAIATNGVVESGGSYFMISRNLGPEFGSAVGILFYLANTVATAMYLVGGVEIMLMYIVPEATIGGGKEIHDDTSPAGMMANNFRLYATILLILECIIVAAGVRFVQLFAPLTLFCVILSVLSIYAGAIHKTIDPDAGPKICMLGDHLLKRSAFMPPGSPPDADPCAYCVKNTTLPLFESFCGNGTCSSLWDSSSLRCIQGMPGFASGVILENNKEFYMNKGEILPGVVADKTTEVFTDLTTTFFKLLAIYFPSVTGIMTGSNMSGDLKNPQQSIPSGTLAAQISTSFVYLSFVLIFGGVIEGPLLRDKYGSSLAGGMVVAELCWPNRWVLLIGSFTSTFGAALQCICSAPRLLQSIAKDNVIPILGPFSVTNRWGEPFRGLLLSVMIAEFAILIGALDYIAPIVELFFLMCYAFVNLVCALHSILGAPNWRPRFRYYHWTFSLLGAALCFFIMFATYWYYAIVALALCLIIYKYVEYKGAKKEWGDGIRGLALSTAQYSLAKIEDKDPHPKNWRPQLLLLMKLSDDNRKMFELASHLKAGKGLAMVASLTEGDPTRQEDRTKSALLLEALKTEMKAAKLKGFAKTIIFEERTLGTAVSTLIQSAGIGGLRPNTILVGWPSFWKEAENNQGYWEFLDSVHRGASQDMCLIVPKGIKNFPSQNDKLSGFIDVWWILHDGGLLILLSFLLQQHKVWKGCKLRLFAVAQQKDNSIKMKEDMETFLYQLRIEGTVHVVELADPEISAYAYERTLRMEERSRLIQDLHLSEKQKRTLPSLFIERHRGSFSGQINHDDDSPVENSETSKPSEEDAEFQSEERDRVTSLRKSTEEPKSDKKYQYTFTPQELKAAKTAAERGKVKSAAEGVDRRKAKKMHTAVNLNSQLLEHSAGSQLVVLNLPRPPGSRVGLSNYMEYLEALTEGLERVLLVRGSGTEVITVFS